MKDNFAPAFFRLFQDRLKVFAVIFFRRTRSRSGQSFQYNISFLLQAVGIIVFLAYIIFLPILSPDLRGSSVCEAAPVPAQHILLFADIADTQQQVFLQHLTFFFTMLVQAINSRFNHFLSGISPTPQEVAFHWLVITSGNFSRVL